MLLKKRVGWGILISMKGRDSRSEASIRSFVAIDISDEIRDGLDKIIAELKPKVHDVRWVKVKGIHLTLKFLGNVAESMIPSLRAVLEEAAQTAKPFDVEIKGLGAFPNPRRARVVWVGVEESSGALGELAGRIEKGMKPLGFKPENRPFHPHLTIGRTRRDGRPGKGLADMIEKYQSRAVGKFTASEITLFRSDLKPTGAVYSKLVTAPLS